MKYLYKILSMALIGTMLYSCQKETYNYSEVNTLSIKKDADTYEVQQRDILTIDPVISTSQTDGGPYTYEWLVYKDVDISDYDISAANPPNKAKKLSSDKKLNVEIMLDPGVYHLQLTITDSKTNLKTYDQSTLTVNGKFYEGWLVTSNTSGKPTVSFVRKDGEVFLDVIGLSNKGMALSGKGLAAFSGVHKQLESVNVFTDQEFYSFNANDFSLIGTSGSLMETKIAPIRSPHYAINNINFDQYIVSNGSVYGALTPYAYGGFGKYSSRFSGPDYSVFPFFMTGSKAYALFYDNKGKRFLHNRYNTRFLLEFASMPEEIVDGVVKVAYDVSAVGKTAVGIDKGPGNEYFLVMKDDVDYYLYSVLPNNASPAGMKQKMTHVPEIAKATSFAVSEANKQMYYAVGNTIYIYDILANSAKVAYQFPANTLIKDLKMFKSKGWGKVDPLFNKRLTVATYNGSEGELYYFDLLPIGDIENNTYSKKFGGFGEIEQINYRNPNL